jgi:hypothetical protein
LNKIEGVLKSDLKKLLIVKDDKNLSGTRFPIGIEYESGKTLCIVYAG